MTRTMFGDRTFGEARGSPNRRPPSPVPISPYRTPPATQLSDDEEIQEAGKRILERENEKRLPLLRKAAGAPITQS